MDELEKRLRWIEERTSKATEGRWRTATDINGRPGYHIENENICIHSHGEGIVRIHDADFIASARTDVPALVKALRYALARQTQGDKREILAILDGDEKEV